ncbi:hypothetical protein IQ260_25490, partial [Leptolyngbya cf. ectocarpi LEGE 11479]
DLCWLLSHQLNHARSTPKKRNFIHARFDYRRYPPSIGYQRKLFLEQIIDKPRFRSGQVNPALYRLELRLAQAILSPFGYGEICFRDFEAILAHTLLLKPSMDHLETWPNIYMPGQTYIKLDWNGHNLLPICDAIFSNQIDVQGIQKNAYYLYQKSLSKIDAKIEEILDEFYC